MNPQTKASELFDWLVIPAGLIDELVGKALAFGGDAEAFVMLLMPLRDAYKRGDPTGAFRTTCAIVDAVYRRSEQHYEAAGTFEREAEKKIAALIEERVGKGKKGGKR